MEGEGEFHNLDKDEEEQASDSSSGNDSNIEKDKID